MLPKLRVFSELSMYMACSQSWAYRFAFGLEPSYPKDSPIQIGIDIDTQFARLARGEEVNSEDSSINKIALRTWADWEREGSEYEFVQIAPEITGMFHGEEITSHPDGLVRDKKGNHWILDLKTHVKLPPEDSASGPQFAIYDHVYRQNGIEPKGFLLPRSLQRLPALPRILKSGRVQKPRSCGLTDVATYETAISLAGHHPSAYKEELEQVRSMRFFRLDKTEWIPGYVDAVIAEMAVPFSRMLRDRQALATSEGCAGRLPQVYRHLRVGFAGCERCRYRELCFDEMVMGPQPGLREALKEQWARDGAAEPEEFSEDILS